jgi:mono/diheme cytochrome c family protein
VLAVAAALLPMACGGSKQPDAARGEKVYNARCWNCHEKDTDAVAGTPGQGPGLKGFASRAGHQDMSGKQHQHNDELVRSLIRNGSGFMPPQGEILSEQDVADLIAYVKTL